jgi:membrane-associated protease RseP (regulator of RpoE activity)
VSGTVGILLFILIILVVIVVHEAGHFAFAKAFGIRVQEFFVGFGPRLWSFRRGETEYGVKAIPLGGYVRILGMNPFEEVQPQDIPRTYGAKPAWQRVLVIMAGPISHFFMALLFLSVYFAAIGTPKYQPVVASVEQTLSGVAGPSPAQQAGLKQGDVVLAVGSLQRPDVDAFIGYVRGHVGQALTITVRRGDETLHLTATPVLSTVGGQRVGRLGIEAGSGPLLSRDRVNPAAALGRSATTVGTITKEVVVRLGDVFGPAGISRIFHLLAGSPRQATDATGLVGGAQLAGEAAQAGAWDALFFLFAAFNIFVGIVNLVPLPPLDGGHLAVIAIEKVTRRKVDPRRMIPVAAVVAGFMVLLTLSLFYLDIVNPLPNPFR